MLQSHTLKRIARVSFKHRAEALEVQPSKCGNSTSGCQSKLLCEISQTAAQLNVEIEFHSKVETFEGTPM